MLSNTLCDCYVMLLNFELKLLQHTHQILLHLLVNLPVAADGFAAFFVAAEDSYEVGIFYLFVKVPDEASAGQV